MKFNIQQLQTLQTSCTC